jgi:hypothetical protein
MGEKSGTTIITIPIQSRKAPIITIIVHIAIITPHLPKGSARTISSTMSPQPSRMKTLVKKEAPMKTM